MNYVRLIVVSSILCQNFYRDNVVRSDPSLSPLHQPLSTAPPTQNARATVVKLLPREVQYAHTLTHSK